MSRTTEATLVKRARERDTAAFEELVARTEVRLYRVALHHMRNESDAQEILQDSYLSAWQNLPRFAQRAQFASWMHRIVVNTSLMRLRTRNRRQESAMSGMGLVELADAISVASQAATGDSLAAYLPDEQLDSGELRHRLETAVNSLPHALKAIFLLRDVRELSTGDSAATLGVSVPAAKTRLHRARRALRASLGDYVT